MASNKNTASQDADVNEMVADRPRLEADLADFAKTFPPLAEIIKAAKAA